ncbi:hypothetical protein LSTR_LSTR005074 [Laodelphax striatellus]|uniref:Transcription elongation factor, mitochondrial n=1 Tax=Laodelphax striatellus TaxID=195883 RepID=A0A482WUC0_LAOST|nr:hypothetical protein LSTR_LSTR005074 [Laodelphax striatellus]
MFCARLLKSFEVDKFKAVMCQTRFGFALSITARPYTNSANEKWADENPTKLTEKEQELVLERLNGCMETPLRIKISLKNLKTIHEFIEENNSFTDIAQLYQLQGFKNEVVDDICKKIVKSSKEKTKMSTNFLTPEIPSDRKEMIKTMVGIDVGASCVSWTKLDCPRNRIENWHMVPLPAAQETKNILSLHDYVTNFSQNIPPGDMYIMESNNWSILSPQMSLRNHVRDAQISAILITILNFNREANLASFGYHNVFFMRSLLASRLFCKLIGNERVSSQQLVQKMFDGEFPEFCTPFEISSILRDFYFSIGKPLREDMCQSLLLTLACRELLLNNKSIKVKPAKS